MSQLGIEIGWNVDNLIKEQEEDKLLGDIRRYLRQESTSFPPKVRKESEWWID